MTVVDTTIWNLRPGDRIRRVALHAQFGGQRQGGISTPTATPRILIFTDPETGLVHGYVDGWKNDGRFDYTGEGQRGDQQMKGGNKHIRDHKKNRRSLHVFNGTGETVTYVGEFTLDENEPFYTTEGPETGGGPIRTVIVFRLLPLDPGTAHSLLPGDPALADAVPDHGLRVRLVPIEERFTEKTVVEPDRQPYEAERREAALVQRFCEALRKRGYDPQRQAILPPGEVKALFTDVYVEPIGLLVEAKGTVERGSFRTAIGQLADYRRFVTTKNIAILLPSEPRSDLKHLAESQSISLVWESDSDFVGLDVLI